MGLGGGAVDQVDVAGIELDKGVEHPLPKAATGPAIEAIVDRRRRAIDRRAILPTASRLQHVDNARQDTPIIHPPRPRLVLRQQWFDRLPLRIAQPKLSCHGSTSLSSEHRIRELQLNQ